MRKRTSVDAVGAALATALGLLGGCGGGSSLNGDGGARADLSPGATSCAAHACANPTPVVVANIDTGYDTCAGGPLRRRAVVDCPSLLPRATPSCTSVGDGGLADGPCATDGDCTRHPNDCDCVGAGSGPPYFAFQCQTPQDTCLSNADCIDTPVPTTPPPYNNCSYSGPATCFASLPGDPLTCQPGMLCGNGRPFLVHGRERFAETVPDRAWARMPSGSEVTTSGPVLVAAAAHWARVGLMEHASIAAFARFTLHLLALGAPPELVHDAQEAIGDETEHARLSFGLASAFGGAPVGPGPLTIDGALDGFDLRDFVATLIREGCIGETLAAIEAREALDHATEPATRAVLETIARDEPRRARVACARLGRRVRTRRSRRRIPGGPPGSPRSRRSGRARLRGRGPPGIRGRKRGLPGGAPSNGHFERHRPLRDRRGRAAAGSHASSPIGERRRVEGTNEPHSLDAENCTFSRLLPGST